MREAAEVILRALGMTPGDPEGATVPRLDEGVLLLAVGRHRPENPGPGCTCGFCAWTAEHVVVMAYREARATAAATPTPQCIPGVGDRVRVHGRDDRDNCTVMDVDRGGERARVWTDDGEAWFPFRDLDPED